MAASCDVALDHSSPSWGMSHCVRQLLRSMLLEPCNLASIGHAIQLSSPTLLRLAITNILADEAAIKAIWSNKGASGNRCCLLCRNVVAMNRDLTSGQEYIVDVSCTDPARFDLASDHDIWASFDRLANEEDTLTKSAFDTLQQAVGLTYDAEGLLADMELRQHVRPTSTVMDWMHNFMVHGCANVEVHAFLACCKSRLGLGFADLKAFSAAAWKWPMAETLHLVKLHEVFSPARERSCSESFKCSASEMLKLFPVLRYFALTIVATTGRCNAEVTSMVYLCDVLDILLCWKRGAAVSRVSEKIGMFLEAHKAAYRCDLMRPKHHYMWHNAKQVERGINMDCWVHERKHRFLKKIAGHVSNTSAYECTVLARAVLEQTRMLSRFVSEDALSGKSRTAADSSLFGCSFCGGGKGHENQPHGGLRG